MFGELKKQFTAVSAKKTKTADCFVQNLKKLEFSTIRPFVFFRLTFVFCTCVNYCALFKINGGKKFLAKFNSRNNDWFTIQANLNGKLCR